MRPNRRARRAVLCLVLTGLTLTATTLTRTALASPPRATPVTLVALGDSWAAGTAAGGRPLVDPSGANGTACRRTDASYPARSGPHLAPQAWTNRACASASSGPNSQFTALSSATTHVTITVGADATGLGALAGACVPARSPAECDAAAARTDHALAALGPALDSSFVELRQRAPAAALVLTTYPHLTEGLACAAGAADPARAHRLDTTVTRLDHILTERASAAGITVVDLRAAFVGHGVCARDPWITPFDGDDPMRGGAPTASGQTVIADAVDDAVTGSPAPGPVAGRWLAPLFPS